MKLDLATFQTNKFLFLLPTNYTLIELLIPGKVTKLIHLDGFNISNYKSLFAEISTKMEFPDYFGHNWNALYDCLTDLSWLPADAYFIVWQNSSKLLLESPDDFWLFLDIATDSAEWWSSRGTPFQIAMADDYFDAIIQQRVP